MSDPQPEQVDDVLPGAGVYLAVHGSRSRSTKEALAARLPVVDVLSPTQDDAGDDEAPPVLVTEALARRARRSTGA